MDTLAPQNDLQQVIPSDNRQQNGPDILKVLWRWKWLSILGGIIGASIGFLMFQRQPLQYKSSVLVQVHKPQRSLQIDNVNAGMERKGIADELLIIRSDAVIPKAVDSFKLTQHPKLLGRSRDEIVGWIKSKSVLETKMAVSNVADSEIISIGITTNDAQLSGAVLAAVVAGYQMHSESRLRESTDETRNVLSKYNDSYTRRQELIESDIEKIKQNSELIWIDGKPVDPSAGKLLAMEENITQLDNRKRSVESLLEQISTAQDAGRPVEESLRLIASSSVNTLGNPLDAIQNSTGKSDLRAMEASIQAYEDNTIFPLRLSLKSEMQTWGEQHPTVMSLRNRLTEYESELKKRKKALKDEQDALSEELKADAKESMSLQTQLRHAVGALKEELSKIELEKSKYRADIDSIKNRVHENSMRTSKFLMNLAELEALGKSSKEIGEALERLLASSQQDIKTITILDAIGIGGFVGPRSETYLGIGALLGFAAFAGIAYLLELADRSYRSPDEIARDLGMPIIGHLPLSSMSQTKRVDDKVDTSIVTLHKSRSALSEAFRGIRTALFFNCHQNSIKVIQVTSPVPGDGKSTIAANVAVSIAQSGRKVCLVDCDFRRPRVAKIFGLREDLGLVQVITGKADLDDAIQTSTIPNLSAVTCGRRPGNPAELLASETFQSLIADLREKFDFVIVDTPPILVVSDPATVSTCVDGVVLTVRLRRNLKPLAVRASQMLHAMNANMIGVVVNGIGVGGNGYGYGGYRYDSYSGSGYGYGQSGYGGYGYGATFQYGGYYGGTLVGKDYYTDQPPVASQPAKTTV